MFDEVEVFRKIQVEVLRPFVLMAAIANYLAQNNSCIKHPNLQLIAISAVNMAFAPIQSMFREFYATVKGGGDITKPFSYLLNMDLIETSKDYQIISDLPGVEANQIDISLEDYSVFITVDREQWFDASKDQLHLNERTVGTINRRVYFPKNADVDNVNVTFKNGVLLIVFPKVGGEVPAERKKLSISGM